MPRIHLSPADGADAPTASQQRALDRGAAIALRSPLAEPLALLSVASVANLIDVAPGTIWRMVAADRFPRPVRLSDRCTRWKAGDVAAWLQAQNRAGERTPARAGG